MFFKDCVDVRYLLYILFNKKEIEALYKNMQTKITGGINDTKVFLLRFITCHTYFKKINLIFFLTLIGFLSNAQSSLLKSFENKSIQFVATQNFDSALIYAHKLLTESKKENSNHNLIIAYALKGRIFNSLNNTKESISCYYEALRLCKDTSENRQKASIYNNLGFINFKAGNYSVAKNNYKSEIKICELLGDSTELANNLINLSTMYRRLKEYDTSNIILKKALPIVYLLKQKNLQGYFYSACGANFQAQYFQNPSQTFYLDSALNNYTKALQIWQQKKNIDEILRPLFNIGLIYQLQKNYTKALVNYLYAKKITDSLGMTIERITVCGNLAELYYDTKNYQASADYFRSYIELKDSIKKVEINKYAIQLDRQFLSEQEIAEYALKLEKQFQVQKNKEIIRQQELRLAQQSKRIYLILFISIIVLSVLIFVLVYFNFKKHLNHKIEEAKKKFFSNVVHEIRTPLSMIQAPLKAWRKEQTSEEDIYYINTAERSIARLNELINQMLDISKIESEKYILSETFGDLELFFNQLVKTYSALAFEKSIMLIHHINIYNKVTFFDKDVLEKIVGNLLSNAIKFTPNNQQIGLDVYTEEKESGINLVINVWDTGVGISTQDQEKIFNRFFRSAETAPNTKGTGIGLSLVKDLVELLHGNLEVKSQVSKGSIFTVNFTLKAPYESTEITITSDNSKNETYQILLVEDDLEISDFNGRYLEKIRFKVLKTGNGKEAIELLQKTLPDLIITDLMMSEMDGFSFLRFLKSNAVTDHIPVIVLSAKTSSDSRLEALKLGAQAFIAKPFLPDELITLVTNQLEILKKKKTEFIERLQQPEIKIEERFVGIEPYTQKLFKLIFQQLHNEQLSVESLAELMATNRSHFQRKVKAITGFSPSELIKTIRLEKAKELLLLKHFNITEIAFQTGFSSQSYFTRCFTQHFGISPTQMLHQTK